mmetsp:Transcript_39600/g.51893  ORF Transcript_39600/g.51893 Transcript_39600/m.51893 type:complete len:137 (+) Transcript_39600:127-537(+)
MMRNFSFVVCRCPFPESPHYNKWLAVEETKRRGWFLPGGKVDGGETFIQAAKREALEEAAMNLVFKGWLTLDHKHSSRDRRSGSLWAVLYAEPPSLEVANNPKDWPDSESLKAEWKTIAELEEYDRVSNLRDPLLL